MNIDEWNSTTKRLNQLKEQTTELQVYITIIFPNLFANTK